MNKAALIGISIFSVVGCAYGPKTEKKSPLNVLNGENYQTLDNGGGDQLIIPIVKRKERATDFQGKVMMKAGLDAVPIQGVHVALFNDEGKELADATSGVGGEFAFTTIAKNGRYKLKTIGGKYTGETAVTVDSYTITKILLQVRRN